MNDFELTYKRFGERSILIEWPSVISENILYNVIAFKNSIKNNIFKDIVEVKTAYNSLLVNYILTIDNFYDKVLILKSIYQSSKTNKENTINLWTIPVCYDTKFGLDLSELAHVKQCSEQDIIQLHSTTIYTIYFIGFLPGFFYLGGLNKKLHQPRRASPRLQIKKGAVGIGGNQTGVYPNVSPGGWNIIGNSPINFFDITNPEPCFAKPGDKIQFKPVSLKTYNTIKTLVDQGIYYIKTEIIHD